MCAPEIWGERADIGVGHALQGIKQLAEMPEDADEGASGLPTLRSGLSLLEGKLACAGVAPHWAPPPCRRARAGLIRLGAQQAAAAACPRRSMDPWPQP